jgi:hypothetical protein
VLCLLPRSMLHFHLYPYSICERSVIVDLDFAMYERLTTRFRASGNRCTGLGHRSWA